MRKFVVLLVMWGLLSVPCSLWGKVGNGTRTATTVTTTASKGFVSLFNGKNLNGWVTMGTRGSFVVKDNAIYTTGAHPYPAWLRSKKQYENFILRFSYKTAGWYEGGILIHAPMYGRGSKMGFKIHIRHDREMLGSRSTGGIYDVAAPVAMANKPAGRWNRCEVLCDWPRLRVTMNGVVIQNLDMSKNDILKYRLRKGYIGIENICDSGAFFKDIEIRPLPGREEWTNLFEGGIKAMRFTGGSKWNIKDNTLTGKGYPAMAYTKKEFVGPFELQVWVKTMVNGNGGVMFNCNGSHGVEVQCFNVPDSTNPTGSLYGICPAKRVVSRDMQWFLIQLFTDGSRATVFVNGEKVSQTDKLKPPYKGTIGFQQHTPKGFIEYRGARIKKLTSGY